MQIINARTYTASHKFEYSNINIKGDRIAGLNLDRAKEDEYFDADGLMAIPALVDIHEHGAVGCDFCDADEKGIQNILDYEASCGVLAVCGTTMTYLEDRLTEIAGVMGAHENRSGADLVGINLEGPFISPERIGAQNPNFVLPPDGAMAMRLLEASKGLVKLLDIAPEQPGAIECITQVKNHMRVSIAHTTCSYDEAMAAFEAGCDHMTHLYNAMPSLHHRDPGPIAAGADSGAFAEIITDNLHIHPSMVRQAFRMFGDERMVLISDSMRACGMPDGIYDLGGQDVRLTGNLAELKDHPGVIAGSATNLFDCMKTAVLEMDIPLESAIRAASENPAASIGIEKDYGSIAEGRLANILLVDDDLNIIRIMRHGAFV